jgi:flagellar motor switch protein FliM
MSETVNPAPASDVMVLSTKGGRELRKNSEIRGHDFRQSGFLAASELRRIRQRQEQFIRSLAARLAIFLRLEFALQIDKLQIAGYQKFTETLGSPTHITLFKTEPLKGTSLLVMTSKLALTFVDRLLGGPGEALDAARDLTEMEVALMDKVAALILNEWCNHWPEMRGMQSSIVGHENNSHFLQTSTPDAAMLILSMTGGVGEQKEQIQMAFPYTTVEPLMRQLLPAPPEMDTPPAKTGKPRWNNEFNEVKVPLIAEWKGLKMSAGDLTRLKPGDVVALDAACAAQVHLRLNQVPKFIGRPGTSNGKWAVQINGAVNP